MSEANPGRDGESGPHDDLPQRFRRLEGAEYDRVEDLLKERVAFTPREWAIARLCSDFRTETGVEMTKIGRNLPDLAPFMDDTYSAQAVYAARKAFDRKVREAGATFLYGALADFYTAEDLDDVMYEATEVAKLLLEVEGADVDVDREREREQLLRGAMQEVRRASAELRHDEVACPHCGGDLLADDAGEETVDVDVPETLEGWKEGFLELGDATISGD